MTVVAVIQGREVLLAPSVGRSVQELNQKLTADADSLTGSAVPHAAVELETVEGGKIMHGDVDRFYDIPD